MSIRSFETEEYYAKYEFSKPYLISVSDCESISIDELIHLGGGSTEEFLKTKLGYPEMPGSELLRSEIASQYQNLNSKDVLVLGSPIEGIYLIMNSLLRKGEHAIVLSPAYDALFNVTESVTENVSRWFLKNENGRWRLDFEQLNKLINKNTKLLILNFPHNPTGFLPSKEELEEIIKITESHGVRIFADEIYRGLEYGNNQIPSLVDVSENAIVLGGASKSLGLPGLRFGWLATKDVDAYKKLYDMKCYTSMCSTQAGEYLGRMAIRAAPKLIEKNIAIIKNNFTVADSFFEVWKDHFQWIKPMAGSVSLMRLNNGSAEKFCIEMAERFGVVLLPAKFMGYEDRYARLGFGRTSFEVGMKAFEKALKEVYSIQHSTSISKGIN